MATAHYQLPVIKLHCGCHMVAMDETYLRWQLLIIRTPASIDHTDEILTGRRGLLSKSLVWHVFLHTYIIDCKNYEHNFVIKFIITNVTNTCPSYNIAHTAPFKYSFFWSYLEIHGNFIIADNHF